MKLVAVALVCIVLTTSCDPTKASVARRLRRQAQAASDPVDLNSSTFINCFRSCPSTFEYNPVCATNGVTYDNPGRLSCANRCGANTERSFLGTCSAL